MPKANMRTGFTALAMVVILFRGALPLHTVYEDLGIAVVFALLAIAWRR